MLADTHYIELSRRDITERKLFVETIDLGPLESYLYFGGPLGPFGARWEALWEPSGAPWGALGAFWLYKVVVLVGHICKIELGCLVDAWKLSKSKRASRSLLRQV